jgi:hypothetical protein
MTGISEAQNPGSSRGTAPTHQVQLVACFPQLWQDLPPQVARQLLAEVAACAWLAKLRKLLMLTWWFSFSVARGNAASG